MKRLIVFGCVLAALLATACDASRATPRVASIAAATSLPASSAAPSDASASTGALAFSQCMRAHDVSHFPDPNGDGTLPKVGPQQLGVSSGQFQAAQQACGYLLRSTSTQLAQTLTGMRNFARCLRSHGLHDWPDPTTDSAGVPVFDLYGRINPDSPLADAVSGECSHLLRPAPGQNGTTLCDGIGEAGCHHYG